MAALEFSGSVWKNGSKDAAEVDPSRRLYIDPNGTTPLYQIQTTPPIKKLLELFIASFI